MLRQAAKAAQDAGTVDPWLESLASFKGVIGTGGIERTSTTALFDHLEVPQDRRQQATKRLAKIMRELGWQATRVRALNSNGFSARLRGFTKIGD